MLTLDQINTMINDTKELIIKEFRNYDDVEMRLMLNKLILAATFYGTIKEHEERDVILSLQN